MNRAKLYKSKKWMYRQFIVKRLTEEEIAELCQTTQQTINRWLHKHELKRK